MWHTRRMNPPPTTNLYKRHRFPAEIISHCVWLYVRFCLSYRDVEELMAARGILLTYETARYRCQKFGQAYANQLHRRRPRPGDQWHLDEAFLTIQGERHYLWRAVDQDGHVLDILVQRRRDRQPPRNSSASSSRGSPMCPKSSSRIACKAMRRPCGDPAQCGTPPASLSQQLCGKLPPAHPPAGTTDAAVQVPQTCPTLSLGLWPHHLALPPTALPGLGPRIPFGDAVTLPNLAGDDGLSHGRIRDERRSLL
jgi:hypothetical protein